MRSLVTSLCTLAVSLTLTGCGAGLDSPEEIGHATGDVMASFDEGGEGGAFASIPRLYREEYGKPALWKQLREVVSPSAEAASCWLSHFSACSAGKRTKTWDSCTLGAATLKGSVELAFSQNACTMQAAADSVTRTAQFTLTGPRAGTLTVSSPGGGQTVTKTATGYTYKVGGMQRSAVDTKGTALFDLSTSTKQDIVVTGTSRANRVFESGQIEVKHNLAGYTTLLTPKQVKWDTTCNCAVSGQWDGTVTSAEGKTADFNVTITGCGKATVTSGKQTKSIELDRCAAL